MKASVQLKKKIDGRESQGSDFDVLVHLKSTDFSENILPLSSVSKC
jgi:hypothetical protein